MENAPGSGPRRRRPAVQRIQSVDRALRLVDAVGQGGGSGRPLAWLSSAIGLNPSTAHHLLSSLQARGYVEQDAVTGNYRLGPAVLTAARHFLRQNDLAQTAGSFLRELHADLDEWVFVAVLRGGQGHFVAELQSSRPFVLNLDRPRLPDLHCTSSNKVLLAGLDPAQARVLLTAQGLPRHTANTVSDLDAAMAEIARVREVGFALNREENFAGLRGASAPVFDATGRLIAAVGAAYPVFRTDAGREDYVVTCVRRTAARLSERLGAPHTTFAAPTDRCMGS